jgi:hypothetical protein
MRYKKPQDSSGTEEPGETAEVIGSQLISPNEAAQEISIFFPALGVAICSQSQDLVE